MTVIAFKAKQRPIPVPFDACRIFSVFGVNVGSAEHGVTYSLRHRRKGTQIMLHNGRLSWNLSHMLGRYPASYREARAFLATYAAQHGQTFAEEPPRHPRAARATGDDAKLLKAGGCREEWLTSTIPSLFAEAAVRCQSPAHTCQIDGTCRYGTCNMEMMPEEPDEPEELDL